MDPAFMSMSAEEFLRLALYYNQFNDGSQMTVGLAVMLITSISIYVFGNSKIGLLAFGVALSTTLVAIESRIDWGESRLFGEYLSAVLKASVILGINFWDFSRVYSILPKWAQVLGFVFLPMTFVMVFIVVLIGSGILPLSWIIVFLILFGVTTTYIYTIRFFLFYFVMKNPLYKKDYKQRNVVVIAAIYLISSSVIGLTGVGLLASQLSGTRRYFNVGALLNPFNAFLAFSTNLAYLCNRVLPMRQAKLTGLENFTEPSTSEY